MKDNVFIEMIFMGFSFNANAFKDRLHNTVVVYLEDEVRQVVERYNKMWGSESSLH